MAAYRAEGFPVTIIRPSYTCCDRKIPLPFSEAKGGRQVLRRILSGKPVIVHGGSWPELVKQKLPVYFPILHDCFLRVFAHKRCLTFRISVTIMFELLPKRQLQIFICFCGLRMFVQVVSEIEFIVVTKFPEM